MYVIKNDGGMYLAYDPNRDVFWSNKLKEATRWDTKIGAKFYANDFCKKEKCHIVKLISRLDVRVKELEDRLDATNVWLEELGKQVRGMAQELALEKLRPV